MKHYSTTSIVPPWLFNIFTWPKAKTVPPANSLDIQYLLSCHNVMFMKVWNIKINFSCSVMLSTCDNYSGNSNKIKWHETWHFIIIALQFSSEYTIWKVQANQESQLCCYFAGKNTKA
jgi:hypothetical protein